MLFQLWRYGEHGGPERHAINGREREREREKNSKKQPNDWKLVFAQDLMCKRCALILIVTDQPFRGQTELELFVMKQKIICLKIHWF